MSVVTLTGDLGSMGRIGRLVAEKLEYDLLEPELTLAASQALAFPKRLQALDRRTQGLGSRFVNALEEYLEATHARPGDSLFTGGKVEEVMSRTYADHSNSRMTKDDRRYFDDLTEVVQFFAKRGRVVMVGRGTQLLLAGTRDTLHVRVVCPLEERIKRVAKEDRDGDSPEVTRRVEVSDRERAAWHRKYFNTDYQSFEHYHLVVNSGVLPDEAAADIIIRAAERLSERPRATGRKPQAAAAAAT